MPRPPGTGTRTVRCFIPVLLGITTVWTMLVLLGWVSESMGMRATAAYPSLLLARQFGLRKKLVFLWCYDEQWRKAKDGKD